MATFLTEALVLYRQHLKLSHQSLHRRIFRVLKIIVFLLLRILLLSLPICSPSLLLELPSISCLKRFIITLSLRCWWSQGAISGFGRREVYPSPVEDKVSAIDLFTFNSPIYRLSASQMRAHKVKTGICTGPSMFHLP